MTFSSILRALRALARRRDGAAAVEFAIISPVVITLIVGSVELTHQIWARGKLHDSAAVLSDLVSRETDLNDGQFQTLMSALPVLLAPNRYRDEQVEVLSLLACAPNDADAQGMPAGAAQYFVLWQRYWDEQGLGEAPYEVGTEFQNQALEAMTIQPGATLIFVQSQFVFQPRIAYNFGAEVSMKEHAFYQPRFAPRVAYSGREDNVRRECDDFV